VEGFTPWPPDLARLYRERGYWTGVQLGDLPHDWAGRYGDADALVWGEARLSYRQLAGLVDRLALGLLESGLRPSQRVVVQLPNKGEFMLLCFALYRMGAIPVLALPAHRRSEIGHLIDLAEASAYAVPADMARFDYLGLAREMRGTRATLDLVLTDRKAGGDTVSIEKLLKGAAATPEEVDRLDRMRPDPGSVALFLLSGGTTGLPKLIPRTHDDYAYNFTRAATLCGFDRETRYLAVLPIAHNFPYGSPGALGVLQNGGTAILAPSPNPKTALPLIDRERITVTAVVPAVALRWMDEASAIGADLSTLDLLQVGGARLAPEAAAKVPAKLGCRLQQVFGMAEGLLNFTRLDEDVALAVETQGRPMSDGDELRIVDPAGQPVPDGQPGELLVRGPYTLRGYFRADEHNTRAFTADGFYRSGDVVIRHPSGNLIVEGRIKDLINRGGEKISAEEIENVMLAHPAIANVAAVAMPDPTLGERICAVVVLRDGETTDLPDLTAFMAARGIAAFKLPERLEIAADLPVTPIGKIDKKLLRDRLAGVP